MDVVQQICEIEQELLYSSNPDSGTQETLIRIILCKVAFVCAFIPRAEIGNQIISQLFPQTNNPVISGFQHCPLNSN